MRRLLVPSLAVHQTVREMFGFLLGSPGKAWRWGDKTIMTSPYVSESLEDRVAFTQSVRGPSGPLAVGRYRR